jgi:hypothetical protein
MKSLVLIVVAVLLAACTANPTLPASVPVLTDAPLANLPNPASAYCEQQGYAAEIRTAADGSQGGVCIFPGGSECDEWAYFRGECNPGQVIPTPSSTSETEVLPTALPTPMAIDAADYQGWWTYTHPTYRFSIMLPEDWIVEQVTRADPATSTPTLILHPEGAVAEHEVDRESIRMTFRRFGDEVLLWPTGVGQGEFITQGTLDIAGQPAQRVVLVCPTGEVTSIWYHQSTDQPNIARGDLEFGFILSATPSHCDTGHSLSGKVQLAGEMIIASLHVP